VFRMCKSTSKRRLDEKNYPSVIRVP